MVILTLNCGSSSAKYQVYDWDNKEVLANGVVERVGSEGSGITHKAKGKKTEVLSPCPTHKEAIELIIKEITDPEVGVISDMSVIGAVGHRVLHGGEKFTKSVLVTPEVLDTFRSVIDLGPLHMPANIMGIEAAQKVLPDVPHRGAGQRRRVHATSCRIDSGRQRRHYGYCLASDNAGRNVPVCNSARMV